MLMMLAASYYKEKSFCNQSATLIETLQNFSVARVLD